jgi:CheY-like chemotaxis protein
MHDTITSVPAVISAACHLDSARVAPDTVEKAGWKDGVAMRPEESPILVVNADPEVRDVASGALSFEGYPVYTASNGAEALEAIESLLTKDPQNPPIMLLEMRLPLLDGPGVVHRLKERGLQVPIVVMSTAFAARAWAVEIGADAYLPEGSFIDDLCSEIVRLCNGTGDPGVTLRR